MTIKRLRIPLLLMSFMLIFGLFTPMTALAASTTLPAGFTGMDSVNPEVDNGYAWHPMTDDEAATYGLEAYKGTNVYLAGGSVQGKPEKMSISNLEITVSKPGMLTFEYAVSTYYDYTDPESNATQGNCLAYAIGTPISSETLVGNWNKIGLGVVRPDENGWAVWNVGIGEDMFVNASSVKVYIVFRHTSRNGNEGVHFAALRNVKFGGGNRSDVVQGYDSKMGTVSVTDASLDELKLGSTYSLTATANSGYQFYGWVKHSADGTAEYTATEDGKLNVVVDADTYYTPVFAVEGTYVLRNGATFYDSKASLKTVIESAKSGDVVVLLKNATISEKITVPSGVTFYVPFREAWEKEEVGYYDQQDTFFQYHLSTTDNKICGTAIAGENKTYSRLTVAEGSELVVNGELVVGSVIGYNSQRFQGHVSGSHGRITNNGRLVVNDGGTLQCYGPVDGENGVVYVEDGGTLKEMFVIGDFAGGNNSAELYFTEQMPFKRFSLQNVQCDLQMEAKAQLVAMANVWASSMYNEAEVVLFGDSDKAAFRPNGGKSDTLVLTRTYHPEQALEDIIERQSPIKGLLDVSGIGRTEWTFSDGLTFQPLVVNLGIIELDTGQSDFTIPYNFKIRLIKGTYNMNVGMRIMPGAEVIVESGASVNIMGRLMVMDGLVQTDMSTDRYPSRAELVAKGFSGSGELIINGTLTMEKKAALGGLIKTTGTGSKLVINEGVYVNNTGTLSKLDQTKELAKQDGSWFPSDGGVAEFNYQGNVVKIHDWVQQDGAKGTYDENTTWFNLPARIYTENGIQKVEAGKTYLGSALSNSETASYEVEYLYVADGVYDKSGYYTKSGDREMTSASETVSHTMSGVWVDSEATEDMVEVTQITVAGSDRDDALTHNVTINYQRQKNGTTTELYALTPMNENKEPITAQKYVFLVKYTVEGDSVGITVSPVDGTYSIPSEANGVSIQACLSGDLNGDGNVKTADARAAYKAYASNAAYAELTELQILAADTNGDGSIKTADARSIYKIYLGK